MRNIFSGERILVVEDDYWIVADLVQQLHAAGAQVVGPVATLDAAMRRLEDTTGLFGAVLDINLGGEMVFALADRLQERAVPYIFVTGYEREVLPARHAHATVLTKPVDANSVVRQLLDRSWRRPGGPSAPLNGLLRAMGDADRVRLAADMEPMARGSGVVLVQPHQTTTHVLFIETGVVSRLAITETGQAAEVGMIGREGMTGVEVVHDDDRAPYQLMTQSEVRAYALPTPVLAEALERSVDLRRLLGRYSQALAIQTGFTALANGRYRLEQRLARWLLMMDDRIEQHRLALTHDFLAVMLGVHRPGVTLALQTLEGRGLIRSLRGQVQIRDRAGLESFADGAYGIPEAEYQRLLGMPIRSGGERDN